MTLVLNLHGESLCKTGECARANGRQRKNTLTTQPKERESIMTNKSTKSPMALALGMTLASSTIMMANANAATNPFGMTELSSGYQVAMEGKCGGNMQKDAASSEGKCGGNMKKDASEGKCGEGKCGGNKKSNSSEGKCGGNMQKDAAEGKCGGNMKKDTSEGKCGGNMGGKSTMEGKCGGNK